MTKNMKSTGTGHKRSMNCIIVVQELLETATINKLSTATLSILQKIDRNILNTVYCLQFL